MTHFLASHEKMCQNPQNSYEISLFWMATMVARKMSHTLGTYELELKMVFHWFFDVQTGHLFKYMYLK
jgi:hypothetical protein